jgi:hypothetical protein
MASRRARVLAAGLLWATACDEAAGPIEPPNPVEESAGETDLVERGTPSERSEAMALTRPPTPESGVAVEPEMQAEPAPPPREAIMVRIARQMLIVRDAPSHGAAIRGRIPMTENFEVFALAEGHDCEGDGWADVGDGGFVCLADTRPGKAADLRELPRMRDRDLAPFFYGKVPKGKVAHRWASEAAYVAGEPPLDTLETGHDYAFTSRRRVRGELLLFDEKKRVVPESQLHRYRPATFQGRDLEVEPVPAGEGFAWTIDWPETPVYAAADATATLAASLGYHEPIALRPEPVAPGWFQLADGSGFVGDRSVGRFVSPEPLAGVADGEVWIDVELEEQVLTVMRGDAPIFVTLVSSGFKAPTPKGIFRIRLKETVGAMASNPGDADPYAVEAVPFIQYFHQGFALHAAYWHNRFGHRISHGCVNLSPRDAKRVFDFTAPRTRAGWIHAYETKANPGTTLRIRRGNAPIVDRRKDVEPVFG